MLKDLIDKYQPLLPVGTSISYVEAEKRAGLFLEAMATITDAKHLLNSEKIKLTSLQVAIFAEEMSKGTDKTVTVNKMNAEASEAYLKAREDLENIENDIAYLKAYYDIMNNAHIFYRNMAKGVNE